MVIHRKLSLLSELEEAWLLSATVADDKNGFFWYISACPGYLTALALQNRCGSPLPETQPARGRLPGPSSRPCWRGIPAVNLLMTAGLPPHSRCGRGTAPAAAAAAAAAAPWPGPARPLRGGRRCLETGRAAPKRAERFRKEPNGAGEGPRGDGKSRAALVRGSGKSRAAPARGRAVTERAER